MAIPNFRSLRFRLISSVVLIEIVMLSLLVWSNMAVIHQAHTDRLRDTAYSMLQQIAATTGSYMVEVDYASLGEYLRNIATHPELAYLVMLDRDGRAVNRLGEDPGPPWPHTEAHPAQVSDGLYDVATDINFAGRDMGRVLMGFSLQQTEQAISAARLRSIAIAVSEIILTILVTVLIGLHLTRRLGQLAQAAQRVGAGDYAVKVPAELADEVGMTATAFNRMVDEVSQRTRRLEESLARERVIEDSAIDGMITYDSSCRILSVNAAMEQLLGYPDESLLGEQTALLLDPLPATAESPGSPQFWTHTTGTRCEVWGRRKDGGSIPLELYIGCIDINGEPLFAATLHDITERKRAERECHSLLDSNRFLIHKSLAVQEEERRYMARELHDEIGQCMTAIQADAEIIHETAREKNPQLVTSASAILNVSSRMYATVHSMMQRLRPTVLDDLGLVPAIEEEVKAWKARHPSVDCKFTAQGELSALGEPVNISLYRIVQESLTNIAKHAQATRTRISLACLQRDGNLDGHDRVVVLQVDDNGLGMDPGSPPSHGLGLIGMRERVEALHGAMAIHSAPGEGLNIAVTVPLAAALKSA